MKDVLKQLFLRVMPGPAGVLQIAWQRRYVRQFEASLGLPQIIREFVARYGAEVQAGPFAGMHYVPRAVGSAFLPKLLGSYERELHEVIGAILQRRPPVLIDIGCAEGYYAIGCARALPETQVYAFERDGLGRRLCAEMARANSVEARVHVAGKCDPIRLNALLDRGGMVICDCEGCEYELLSPERVPGLRRADLLVELHPDSDPDLSANFLKRFEKTHRITLVTGTDREPDAYPPLRFLSPQQRSLAVSEFRTPGQQWAYMSPIAETAAEDAKEGVGA